MLCYSVVQPRPDFPLRLVATSDALVRVNLDDLRPDPAWFRDENHPVLSEARRQLELYFQGALRRFDLRLQPKGTPFQLRVWRALVELPYGQTCSYADIARSLQPPSVARAVGQANAANPLAIVVPCHRVIAYDGTLGGYGPGLRRKRFLLDLEKRAAR